MRNYWIVLLALISVVLSGCGSALPAEDQPAPLNPQAPPATESGFTSVPVSPVGEDLQMTPSLSTPADPGLQNLIDKATADLAQRLSIPANQIKLMETRKVVWPDASMGCPQPDLVYAQVPVDGLLIRLAVGKDMYLYHTGGTADPFLCEGTSPVIPNTTPKTDELVPPPDSEIH